MDSIEIDVLRDRIASYSVRDQGRMGSSWAHAIANAVAMTLAMSQGGPQAEPPKPTMKPERTETILTAEQRRQRKRALERLMRK